MALAGEDLRRLGQRHPAPPPPHGAGVAGGGHRPVADVGVDEDLLARRVRPAHAALGLGPREAVGDEGLRHQVELPGLVRVRAAAGQGHQRPGEGRAQHPGAVPHPADALGLGEGVDVDEHLPLRLGGAVGRPGGAPPDAAHVLGVGPEVVEVLAALDHAGDLRGGVEDLEDAGAQLGEPRRGGQRGLRLGVAGPDPRQGLLALDVLEPAVRVLGHHGGRGPVGVGGARHACYHITGRGRVGAAAPAHVRRAAEQRKRVGRPSGRPTLLPGAATGLPGVEGTHERGARVRRGDGAVAGARAGHSPRGRRTPTATARPGGRSGRPGSPPSSSSTATAPPRPSSTGCSSSSRPATARWRRTCAASVTPSRCPSTPPGACGTSPTTSSRS